MNLITVRGNTKFKAAEVCAAALYHVYDEKATVHLTDTYNEQAAVSIGTGWKNDPASKKYGLNTPASNLWNDMYVDIIPNVVPWYDDFLLEHIKTDVYQKVIADIEMKPPHVYPTLGTLITLFNVREHAGFTEIRNFMANLIKTVITWSYQRWSLYLAELDVMENAFNLSYEENLEVLVLPKRCKSVNLFLRMEDPGQFIKFIIFPNEVGSYSIWTVDYNHNSTSPYVLIERLSGVELLSYRSDQKMATAASMREAIMTALYSLYVYYSVHQWPYRLWRWWTVEEKDA